MELSPAAVSLTVAAALGWSVLDLLRRLLADRLDALSLVAWVTMGALPPLLAWCLVAGFGEVDSGYIAPAAGSVGLNLAANFAYFRSLQLSPVSQTLPMLAFTPGFAALLGAAFLGERMSGRAATGMVAVVFGALLLTLSPGRGAAGLLGGFARQRGAHWMIGVALCWSATLLLDKQALGHATPQLHALILNAGVACGALAALAARRELGRLREMRTSAGLLAATVLVSAVALALQLLALGSISLGSFETVKRGAGCLLAVVWGRTFFGEPLGAAKLAAVVVLTAGVGLLVL